MARSYIVDKDSASDGENPHEEWSPRINHAKRSHGSHTAKVTLCIVLLGMVRADISTFDISLSAFIHDLASLILTDIVTDES